MNPLEYLKLNAQHEELRRFARDALEEARRALKKRGRLGPSMRQLAAYLQIMDEREKPELERIRKLLEGRL